MKFPSPVTAHASARRLCRVSAVSVFGWTYSPCLAKEVISIAGAGSWPGLGPACWPLRACLRPGPWTFLQT
jgi:hypothetical protein